MPETTIERLEWDKAADKIYNTGVKEVVLYTGGKAVAWNGITAVNESPSGAEATALFANDKKYLELRSAEEYGFTIEAYTYPDEFEACDGSATVGVGVTAKQQNRAPFGISYITTIGNEEKGNDYGQKLHVIYGATASPSARDHATINDSPEAITFSWECTTTPITFDYNNGSTTTKITTSVLEFDSTKMSAASWKSLIDAVQDKTLTAIPTPETLIAIPQANG